MTPSGPSSSTTTRSSVSADRDEDVREAREHERDRALLDPEERGQLLVVHVRPERDAAPRARGSRRLAVPKSSVGDRAREARAARTSPSVAIAIVNQNDVRRTRSRPVVVVDVEVEAEERGRDAEAQDDREHGDERDERLDLPVVGRGRGSACRAAAGGRRGSARRARRGRRSRSACRAA